VRHLLGRRILFFGGKGGVGKTTCSSALALAASRSGRRVLLVSTDPAHSTSDIFERPFGPEEQPILPGLWGVEIDEEAEARRYLSEAKERIARAFSPAVVREAARQIELAASMPGVTDVALFERMSDILLSRGSDYDLVVFDTAPTGHALRLLRMPELMEAWVGALMARRRESAAAAATGATGPNPGTKDPILASLEARAARLQSVRAALQRPEDVAFVLVLIPERLPIEESARAIHLLEDAGVPLGGVIVNRVLPDAATGEFFVSRKAQERVYLDEIERRFSGARRVRVPQLPRDVHGVESLERIAARMLREA
jgi:arsenite-transporting ATPase